MSELINGLDNWLDSRHQSDLDDRVSECYGADPGVENAIKEDEENMTTESQYSRHNHLGGYDFTCPECANDSSNEEKNTVASNVLDSAITVDSDADQSHSPLPWREHGYRDQVIVDANGTPVLVLTADPRIDSFSENITRMKDNRSLVITAVNSYGPLRDALKRAMGAFTSLPKDALGRDPLHGHYYRDELLSQIVAALEEVK